MLTAPLAVQPAALLATSALPDAPTVPESAQSRGRTRLAAAAALRRAADRLATERPVLAAR